MKRVSLTSLSTAVLILAAAALRGQEAPPSRSFDEELSVEVINVEVYVTDRKGVPVRGLGRADFRLLEDGDPVAITHFSELGPEAPAPAAEAPSVEAEAGPAAAPALPAHDLRNLVIYLDDANVSPAGRRRVLADLRQALAAAIGRFYVVLTGRAATGEILPVKGREILVAAAPGAEPLASRTLVVEVDLPQGPHEVAVGVLDYQGGGETYLRADIDVGPPAEGAPPSR